MTAWNWNPGKVCVIDLHTQSAADRKHCKKEGYLRNPSTRLLSAVALIDKDVIVWAPKGRCYDNYIPRPGDCWPEGFDRDGRYIILDGGLEVPKQLTDAIAAGHTFVAHNADFSADAWGKLVGGPQPAWYDLDPMCRAAGLPTALDALSVGLLGRQRDDGKAAELLTKAGLWPDGRPNYPRGTPSLWRHYLQRSVADVLLLAKIYHLTKDVGEEDVLSVDRAINARGIQVDRNLLYGLLDRWRGAKNDAARRLTEITRGALDEYNMRNDAKVKDYLRTVGVNVGTLDRRHIGNLFANLEALGEKGDEQARRALEILKLRRLATQIAHGKLERLLVSIDEDNRVRDMLVYHGAQTGRWTGRGFQPHNLPRGLAECPIEEMTSVEKLTEEQVYAAADQCGKDVGEVLSTLLRPVLCAADGKELLIADYSAIEPRCLAWLAGERSLLAAFSDPSADVYCDFASKLFGRPVTRADKKERDVGKVAVIGFGYGLGEGKAEEFCRLNRVDLAAVGLTGKQVVEAYRDAYPMIARRGGLWQALNAAALDAVKGQQTSAGGCQFRYGGALVITLPSGRPLVYQNARVERRETPWGEKDEVVYDHPSEGGKKLYGGLLAENVTQAICRDILATALVRLEAAGLPVVLHVHDEIVVEATPDRLPEMCRIMTKPPAWASRLPILVEGFSCPRYTKTAFSSSSHCKAFNGETLS
jgi:DNA polymerase